MNRIYFNGLPIATVSSIMIGYSVGLTHTNSSVQPHERFFNIIGMTTLALFTGVSYPISFPILFMRYVYIHVNPYVSSFK